MLAVQVIVLKTGMIGYFEVYQSSNVMDILSQLYLSYNLLLWCKCALLFFHSKPMASSSVVSARHDSSSISPSLMAIQSICVLVTLSSLRWPLTVAQASPLPLLSPRFHRRWWVSDIVHGKFKVPELYSKKKLFIPDHFTSPSIIVHWSMLIS